MHIIFRWPVCNHRAKSLKANAIRMRLQDRVSAAGKISGKFLLIVQ